MHNLNLFGRQTCRTSGHYRLELSSMPYVRAGVMRSIYQNWDIGSGV